MKDSCGAPALATLKYKIDVSKREFISCPVCATSEAKEKYVIGSWKVVLCDNCSFAYVNPRLEKKELYKLYESDYFDNKIVGYYHYTDDKILRKRNFQKWVKDALPYVKANHNLKALDIGCAAGYCLEVFQEHGWQPHGVELDHQLAGELRRKGFTVFDSPLLQLKDVGKYAFVTMFDVVEHLTDLHENISTLRHLLEDDGVAVLVTPNYNSWQRRIFQKKWFQFKPVEHINYFTLATFRELVEANGFRILETKNSGQFCNIAFLENRLRQYNFIFLQPLLRLTRRLLGKKERFFYVDTASLYIVMQKSSAGK